jgi:hypothetical protein
METQRGMDNTGNNLRQDDIYRGFYDFNRFRINEHTNSPVAA